MEMTWADRLLKSGRQEGRRKEREKAVRALRPLVLELLGERFGPLPEPVRNQVQAIDSVERLTRLARLGLTAESLEEMGLEMALTSSRRPETRRSARRPDSLSSSIL